MNKYNQKEIDERMKEFMQQEQIKNSIMRNLWQKRLQQNPILKDLKLRNFKEGEI